MSDENNKNKYEHLTPENAAKAQKAVEKLSIVRELKKLSGDSKWTPTQVILQEIVASHTIINPDALPPASQLKTELENEVNKRYADDEELRDLLLSSIPSDRSIREWLKKDGWNEAVWDIIRQDGLFTKEKRAQMIESLRMRGMEKSDVAAKIWLTLSGDYSEKMDISNNDKTQDVYREINKILHKKKDD